MKYLIVPLFILAIFSCENQSNNLHKTVEIVELPKAGKLAETDTNIATSSVDSTYQARVQQNTKRQDGPFTGLSGFYKRFEKNSQSFTLNAEEKQTIKCKEGTEITFQPGSFVTESGQQVTGGVVIRVTEYYKISDILLANLTTNSNDGLLETAGMLNVEAYYNGLRRRLIEEKPMRIAFPTTDKKDDMQLFNGSWTEDRINWTLQAKKPDKDSQESILTFAESMPEFPGSYGKLVEYISDNLIYPEEAKELGIQGTVYVRFTINENGRAENAQVLRSPDLLLSQAAISMVETMPSWIPAKQADTFVKVSMTLPLRFFLSGAEIETYRTQYAKDLKREFNDSSLSKASISAVSAYLFSSSKLGWINCDRFYRNSSPRVDYSVNVGSSQQAEIKIIFNDINSVLNAWVKDGRYVFYNLPIGMSITLFAVKREDGQYYLATKKTRISRLGEPELTFKPVTMTRLKAEMEKLNQI